MNRFCLCVALVLISVSESVAFAAIEQTTHLAESEEQFHRLFGAIYERIQLLLKEIDRRAPRMVAPIEEEVKAGELDPFWARKLEMLVELELIA